ncbi:MAG: sulfite exporter TauE/SafE family protein [Hyphomicrobiales bacterium]
MNGLGVEQYLGLVALGLGVGAYGTLIGAGGGFVLMPVLLLLYRDQNPDLLTSISLAVVFFNALSGSEAYAMMKRIDYRSGLMFAAATIPGAILGALNTSLISRRLFDLVFGVLLVAAAVFLVGKPQKFKARGNSQGPNHLDMTRRLVDVHGTEYKYSFNYLLGMGISVVVGYVSSFLGIGGGIIHVPALTYFLNFPVHVATATSHFILAIMALTGTVVHIMTGTFTHGVHRTLALSIGVLLGAQIGARLSEKIQGSWIIRGLAIALGVVGLRILTIAW